MKKFQRSAFTMVELVFVIVILGILAAIAIPKLAASRDDAEVAKGRSDIAAIRAAIVSERQSRLLRGETVYISKLHTSTTLLFDGNGSSQLLQYGIAVGNTDGHWNTPSCTGAVPNVCTYVYTVMGQNVTFTYTQADGNFSCSRTGATGELCKQLID